MIYFVVSIVVGILLILYLRTKEPKENKVSEQWIKENKYEKKP